MRLRKISIAGLMVVAGTLAVLLAACGSSSTGGGQAPDSQQVFKPGLGVSKAAGDFDTLDPALVQFGADASVLNYIWPGLVELDQNLTVQPYAAQALPTVDSTGTVYTIKIKPNLKFTDGEAIDASTYAFSINRALDPCTASPVSYYLANIKDALTFSGEDCSSGTNTGTIKTLIGDSIVVVDPQTLQITIDQPAAYFLAALTYPISFAVPPNVVQQYGKTWLDHITDNGGLSGGPFKPTLWDHAGHFNMVRNDSYWGDKPILREIDYTLYNDPAVEQKDYVGGKNDWSEVNAGADYAAASQRKDFKEVQVLTVSGLVANWGQPPFDDVRVRQAFSLALDRQAIATNILKGSVVPTYHIVPQGMPGYDENLKNPEGTTALSDVTKAKELATAYAAEKCGGDFSKCPAVTFYYRAQSDTAATAAAAYLQMWQTAFPNWPITTQPIERAQQIARGKELQFTTWGWIADYPDAQDWLSIFYVPGAQYNWWQVDVPEATALMQKADAEADQNQRIADYNAAEQLIETNVGIMPLYQNKYPYLVRDYVKNYDLGANQEVSVFNISKVYIATH